jgi:AdoMet-dependent rRNA methyltransferase SPB1
MDITTCDVSANCEDLKVLGKGDFKALIKWRLKLREEVGAQYTRLVIFGVIHYQLGLDVKTKDTEEMTENVEVEEAVDEEQQISEEVSACVLNSDWSLNGC